MTSSFTSRALERKGLVLQFQQTSEEDLQITEEIFDQLAVAYAEERLHAH